MSLHALLVELEYDTAVRPCDLGHSSDGRLLAVAFDSLRVSCATTGRILGRFDFSGGWPSGFHPIFGLSAPEHWGVWSEGRRSCFLLSLEQDALPSGYRLHIEHHIVDGESSIGARVRANGLYVGNVHFVAKGDTDILIPQEHTVAAISARSSNTSLQPAAEPALSVIILNYNRWELTASCIISLLSSDIKIPYNIVVLDNGSSAAQFAELTAADLPIQITRLDERCSFGEANNLAAEHARGSRLLLLNNDAFVQPSCITHLYEALESPRSGAAGPVFEEPDGRVQEAGSWLGADGNITLRDFNCLGRLSDMPALSNVDHISAACLMLKKDDFIQLGGFDPVYEPAYHEDVDFCCRLRAAGQTIALARDARAVHIRNATRDTLSSSDPVLSAPARNLRVFRSRWGKWLWTRDPGDAAPTETLPLGNWEQQLNAFGVKAVNAVLTTGSVDETQDALAISSALSNQRPTLFSAKTPSSMLRLLRLGRDLQLPVLEVAAANESALGEREIEVLVQSTCVFPPEKASYGKRRFLHCPMPVRAKRLTNEERTIRIEALSGFEAIITNSEISRRKLLGSLSYIGAAHVPILVIRPPVAAAAPADFRPRQDLIVSIGPFLSGTAGGTHDPILRAFKNLQRASEAQNWELVCIGEIYSQEDVSYFNDFALRAASWGVRCIAMPTEQQRRKLYRQAKICVSAAGLGVPSHHENRIWAYSGSVGKAIVQGCVPVVHAGGVEAELCESLGMSFTFHAPEEIEEQIFLAANFARCEDALSALRERTKTLSMESFLEKWQQVLRVEAPSDRPYAVRAAFG